MVHVALGGMVDLMVTDWPLIGLSTDFSIVVVGWLVGWFVTDRISH